MIAQNYSVNLGDHGELDMTAQQPRLESLPAEAETEYQKLAKLARQEGYDDIANWFESISKSNGKGDVFQELKKEGWFHTALYELKLKVENQRSQLRTLGMVIMRRKHSHKQLLEQVELMKEIIRAADLIIEDYKSVEDYARQEVQDYNRACQNLLDLFERRRITPRKRGKVGV